MVVSAVYTIISGRRRINLPRRITPKKSIWVPLIMNKKFQFTAVIEKEGDGYVSLCPELDIASQGETVEEAAANLKEAVELFFENASIKEIKQRLHEEIRIGTLQSIIRQSGLSKSHFEN